MAKATQIKPEERNAREYADRLILEQLTDLYEVVKPSEIAERLVDSGIGLGAVRSLLASNPVKFAYSERRWVPASRLEAVGRPFNEVVRILVDRFGGPMPVELIVQELVRTRGLSASHVERTLARIAKTDPRLFITNDQEIALASWVFVATDETLERGLALNKVSYDDVEALRAKLGSHNWLESGAIEAAVKRLAPVPAKLVGALAWSDLLPEDPHESFLYHWRAFNADLLNVPGFVYSASGILCDQSDAKKWINLAVRLADKLVPSIEVEDVAPLELSDEDVDKMVAMVEAAEETSTATSMLELLFELTPSVKTFPDDLANGMAKLKSDPRVWWVGGDRFRKPNSAPDEIYVLPEPFLFPTTDFRNEEGDLVDAELTDEGLSSSMRRLLQYPLAMDVNDEVPQPITRALPDSLELRLKPIHRELGTFPLCQIPTGWFDDQPKIQELILIDHDGRELQVWLNNEVRLMFNLIDWWLDQQVESGAVFRLSKTARPNVLEFEWLDQSDPLVYISGQRMEELRDLAERSAEMSTFDILREVMARYTKGAEFLTILWEMNVVRRTSRRMVASLLSSYVCFYQRSGSPVWHYDAKKVDAGFDKAKKKFIKKDA